MWMHGINFNQWKFTVGDTRQVIEFLQSTYPYPWYEKFGTVKSFVYRAIGRLRDTDAMPGADPFRVLRGEDKPKVKVKRKIHSSWSWSTNFWAKPNQLVKSKTRTTSTWSLRSLAFTALYKIFCSGGQNLDVPIFRHRHKSNNNNDRHYVIIYKI